MLPLSEKTDTLLKNYCRFMIIRSGVKKRVEIVTNIYKQLRNHDKVMRRPPPKMMLIVFPKARLVTFLSAVIKMAMISVVITPIKII